jgi:hypothetical protein
MSKLLFSRVIKISAKEVKSIAVRGNQILLMLELKPGEGFVVYGVPQIYLCLTNKLLS